MKNDKQSEYLLDRVRILQGRSGLVVKAFRTGHDKGGNHNIFQFLHNGQSVKEVSSYKKALAFADGVRLGRDLGIGKTTPRRL
tara:strand:- start:2465 stop:2713 length:249 start_codon:yes stop_codon:yes gene_type:complete